VKESYAAEIESLKAQLASINNGSGLVVVNHNSNVVHQGDALSLRDLQLAKEATETKYNRLKAVNESYAAEIESLKTQLNSIMNENRLVALNHNSTVVHREDTLCLQNLQFAKEATESKYNRLKADFEDFQSERRLVIDVLRASCFGPVLAEYPHVDLPQLITKICDKSACTGPGSQSSLDVDSTRMSLAITEAEKVELERQLILIRKQDSQKAQFLEESDRNVKNLQLENMDLIKKLKTVRKERDDLKMQKNMTDKRAYMDGLVPSSAAKVDKAMAPSLSHGRSPVRSSAVKAMFKTEGNHATEKENSGNARNPTPLRSSTKLKTTPGASAKNGLPQKKPDHSSEMNAAYGPADEPTGDCKQS
jgi:hypothetical protein